VQSFLRLVELRRLNYRLNPFHPGVTGLTVSEVKGFGRQKGHTEMYRSTMIAETAEIVDPRC
jgi:nitrogen regulatory protein PII